MKENSKSVKGIDKQLNSKKLLSKKKKSNCKNSLLSWFLCCKNLTYGQDKWIVIFRVKLKSIIIISRTMKLLMPWNHQWKVKLRSWLRFLIMNKAECISGQFKYFKIDLKLFKIYLKSFLKIKAAIYSLIKPKIPFGNLENLRHSLLLTYL